MHDDQSQGPALTAIEKELNSLHAAKEKGCRFQLQNLKLLLSELKGWPFEPDDQRAAELVQWIAAQVVKELQTGDVAARVLDEIKSAFSWAVQNSIRSRYSIPDFLDRTPWLNLPYNPLYGTRPDHEKSGAHREWLVKCEQMKAEHQVALAAHDAKKKEYHATYDEPIRRRDAEIEAAKAAFPAKKWQRLIEATFRKQALELYRLANEASDQPYDPPIVEGFLRPGEPSTIGGRLKACKTTISIELAAALTTGAPFLGMAVAAPVNVWVLTKETPAPLWRERFELAVKSRGHDPKAALARLLLTSDINTVRKTKKREELTSYLLMSQTRVAILDPLYTLLSRNP